MNRSSPADSVRGGLAFVANRPVAITMFFVALAVFGLVSLVKLPVDLLPEISYPTLTVRTTYAGAAPEDVEDRVSVRIQEQLSTLPDLVRTSSVSRAGFSDVLLEFNWGTNMTFAVQEVRDRLDGVFLPQDAARPLILRYDPNLDPILRIGVRPPAGAATGASIDAEGDAELDALIRLRWLGEKRLKRELEGLEGVAAVQVRGGLEEEILISVDPARLAAYGIDSSTIGQRLAAENLNASSGEIREGSTEYLVRTLNEFKTVEEIEELAILRRADAVIRVRDLGNVRRTFAEREVVTRIDGAEAVELAIYREAGANIVSVAEAVREAVFGDEKQQATAEKLIREGRTAPAQLSWDERSQLGFLAWNYRKDADLSLLSDQSTFIGAAVEDVRNAAILGGLLAIAVMWFFLRRVALTSIIGLAIPISVIVTFAPMFMLDVSLNIMSLGGLALGIGMLVDNAIVVLESISRCREEGDSNREAAVRGVGEVAGAITASTLTTVAVFAPIVFVHGIAGQIFGDQAVTVVSALLVSLLAAVLFIPMLAARDWLMQLEERYRNSLAWIPAAGRALVRNPMNALLWPVFCWRFAGRWILTGLRRDPRNALEKLFVVAIRCVSLVKFVLLRIVCVLLLTIAAPIWLLGQVRRFTFDVVWNAIDTLYPRVLGIALRVPLVVLGATALLAWGAFQRAGALGQELLPEIHQGEFTAFVGLEVGTPIEVTDRVFRAIDREVGALDGVATTSVTVGVEEDTLTREIEGKHTGRVTVRLSPEASTPENELALEQRVRELIAQHPEVAGQPVFRRPTPFALESPIAVEVRGWDLEVLGEVADEVARRMRGVPGLKDVQTTVRPGHPEARVVFDRDKTLEYGLDLGTVSDYVRDQVLGKVDTRFVEGDDRIDIRVRGDRNVLGTVDAVYNMVVNPTSERPVPLQAVASIEEVTGPAEIRRIGNSRAVLVTAASDDMDLAGVTGRIAASLSDMRTPGEIEVELGGQKRELDEGSRSLQLALLLAIFLVYVVMATQFESLLQPLIILFSVPLAGVGVVYALDILEVRLSVVVFIGAILLAGIVVNNAIVLLDRANQRRAEGLDARASILEAGRARLRPILMTTATTVLGLLPLTGWLADIPGLGGFGAGEGAELRAPMAITVIAGLVSSTLLTLIVIPCIYRLVTWDRGSTSAAPDARPAGGPFDEVTA